jgi:hypothetical protein
MMLVARRVVGVAALVACSVLVLVSVLAAVASAAAATPAKLVPKHSCSSLLPVGDFPGAASESPAPVHGPAASRLVAMGDLTCDYNDRTAASDIATVSILHFSSVSAAKTQWGYTAVGGGVVSLPGIGDAATTQTESSGRQDGGVLVLNDIVLIGVFNAPAATGSGHAKPVNMRGLLAVVASELRRWAQ